MNREQSKNLLSKYYNGETTLEEEALLKSSLAEEKGVSPETDIFSYYSEEGQVPHGLEESIFASIKNAGDKKKSLTRQILTISSVAASLVICFAIFFNVRENRDRKLEEQFFVMEQAMFRVSETIQPEEPQEMLVLWVDDNVEIIIN